MSCGGHLRMFSLGCGGLWFLNADIIVVSVVSVPMPSKGLDRMLGFRTLICRVILIVKCGYRGLRIS